MAAAATLDSVRPLLHSDRDTIVAPQQSHHNYESLSSQINTATRSIHTDLNRIIIARIPLALPPSAPSPDVYLQGLYHFAQLYYSFEDAWQDLICTQLRDPQAPEQTRELHLRALLSSLIDPRLWRTQRLESDIAHLKHDSTTLLTDPSTDSLLVDIRSHIESTTSRNPHLLLAYAWVLYMAIFSGGRWIRSQLALAGPTFWRRKTTTPVHAGNELFYFDGLNDGDDIKTEFKTRFAKADNLLSQKEKEEVVQEAQWIFAACLRLVEALDDKLASLPAPVAAQSGKEKTKTRQMPMPKVIKEALPQTRIGPAGNSGIYMTDGMSTFAAGLAILLGLAVWYALHSAGLGGNNLGGLFGGE